jgi:hypothetical protein
VTDCGESSWPSPEEIKIYLEHCGYEVTYKDGVTKAELIGDYPDDPGLLTLHQGVWYYVGNSGPPHPSCGAWDSCPPFENVTVDRQILWPNDLDTAGPCSYRCVFFSSCDSALEPAGPEFKDETGAETYLGYHCIVPAADARVYEGLFFAGCASGLDVDTAIQTANNMVWTNQECSNNIIGQLLRDGINQKIKISD